MNGLKRPKIELDWAFTPVLITNKFDDDFIKNEWASMETPFSHYKSMGNFLDAQGQQTPQSRVRSGRNSNSFQDFMHGLVNCKYKKDRIKSNQEKVETPFSPL